MKKSILVLSGGLDSTVSSLLASQETRPLLALTFDYGQRAALKEQESSRKIAKRLEVPHQVLSLPWLSQMTSTALVNRSLPLPHLQKSELDNLTLTSRSAASVWVPNRNGLFLNMAACFAESLGADVLITGFNAEESVTFPDNSPDFVEAADRFFYYATQRHVQVQSYTLHLNKIEIVKRAVDLHVSFKDLWFCYEGGEVPCRTCESCLRAFRAFQQAGVQDPWGDE